MWRGAAEAELFDVQAVLPGAVHRHQSAGSARSIGNYLGAILIVALPVILNIVPRALGLPDQLVYGEHVNTMTIGALIIFFLIVEPHGLSRFWQIIREKPSSGRFPH